MTRAGLYALALVAVLVAAVFTWRVLIGAGVIVGAYRFVVRRARTTAEGTSPRLRFGLVPSVSMLYASWNTRRLGRELPTLRCRLGLHSWVHDEVRQIGYRNVPEKATYQRCVRPACPRYSEWSLAGAEPAPLRQCSRGHIYHGWPETACPQCRIPRTRKRRRK